MDKIVTNTRKRLATKCIIYLLYFSSGQNTQATEINTKEQCVNGARSEATQETGIMKDGTQNR